MALSGATIQPKITLDPSGSTSYADTSVEVGVVKSLSPSSSTTTVTETGIGGISKKRLSAQEFAFGWEGLVTVKEILNAGLPLDDNLPLTLEIMMHTEKLTGAKVESMTLSSSEGEALRYSLEGKFLSSSTASAPTYSLTNTFFAYSDGTISIGGDSSMTVKSFEINVSRNIDFVYGTSLSPTSLDVGSTTTSGSVEIEADAFSEAMDGAVASDASAFDITLSFENPITSETMLVTLGDCQFNSAEGSVDPDSSLVVTKGFEADTITVAAVT